MKKCKLYLVFLWHKNEYDLLMSKYLKMLLKQIRIRNLSKLNFIKNWSIISLGVNTNEIWVKKLENLWLNDIEEWILLLPPIVWHVSKYNAEGKEIKRTDLPKESHEVDAYRERKERRWRWKTETVSSIITRTYKRYPREYIPPAWILIYKRGDTIYSNKQFILWKNDNLIIHTINLFLELFGECIIFDQTDSPIINTTRMKKLNRELIKPWITKKEFKTLIKQIIKQKTKNSIKVHAHRLKVMDRCWFIPIWYGKYGFHWYIAYTTKDKKYIIFENVNFWNAIYITGNTNREEFSKLDKQTILQEWRHKDRITHSKWREQKLKKYS